MSKEQIVKIIDLQLEYLRKRLASRNVKLELTTGARQLLAEEGYDPAFGARPLKRVIQQRIENPLATKLLDGEFGDGDTVVVDLDKSKHQFEIRKRTPVVEGELVEETK